MKKLFGLLSICLSVVSVVASENQGFSVEESAQAVRIPWESEELLTARFTVMVDRPDLYFIDQTRFRLERIRNGVTQDITSWDAIVRVKVIGEGGTLDAPLVWSGVPVLGANWPFKETLVSDKLVPISRQKLTVEVYASKDHLRPEDETRTTFVQVEPYLYGAIPLQSSGFGFYLARVPINVAVYGYIFKTIGGIGRDLSLGSTGEDVRTLQKILNQSADTKVAETGPTSPGQESSFFGPATEAALKKWQSKYEFEVTGVTGPQTRSALNAVLAAIVVGGGGVSVVEPAVVEPGQPAHQPQDITGKYSPHDIRIAGRICAFFLEKPLPFDVTINLVIDGRSHWQFDSEDARFIMHNSDRTLFVIFPMPERLVEELAGRKPEIQLFR